MHLGYFPCHHDRRCGRHRACRQTYQQSLHPDRFHHLRPDARGQPAEPVVEYAAASCLGLAFGHPVVEHHCGERLVVGRQRHQRPVASPDLAQMGCFQAEAR